MGGTMTMPVRVPDDIGQRYTRLAKQTGRTRSCYIVEALVQSIDRLEYEYGLRQQAEDYRAGKLATVSLDDAERILGLEV
ncbi:hypothetical protein [Cutibacterium sp.]|uniref:type II toxin-antitoxin system RelB family antitoxin n=1 Tax=Cutibacterium sp. TaxID=1912221 RepID=UPI0026DBA055|nr:hypothetical protein [Cutibacterium sp.]MDO4413069.1 hypothetical protein [Cutibacterium sp.]